MSRQDPKADGKEKKEEKKLAPLLFCCRYEPEPPGAISRQEDEDCHICIPGDTSYRLCGRLMQLRSTFILCLQNATQIT
ncbi:hypothetical protein ABVT39_023888 [Epinephelus coioides]